MEAIPSMQSLVLKKVRTDGLSTSYNNLSSDHDDKDHDGWFGAHALPASPALHCNDGN